LNWGYDLEYIVDQKKTEDAISRQSMHRRKTWIPTCAGMTVMQSAFEHVDHTDRRGVVV
jgi:hypothetical protein